MSLHNNIRAFSNALPIVFLLQTPKHRGREEYAEHFSVVENELAQLHDKLSQVVQGIEKNRLQLENAERNLTAQAEAIDSKREGENKEITGLLQTIRKEYKDRHDELTGSQTELKAQIINLHAKLKDMEKGNDRTLHIHPREIDFNSGTNQIVSVHSSAEASSISTDISDVPDVNRRASKPKERRSMKSVSTPVRTQIQPPTKTTRGSGIRPGKNYMDVEPNAENIRPSEMNARKQHLRNVARRIEKKAQDLANDGLDDSAKLNLVALSSRSDPLSKPPRRQYSLRKR